MTLRSVDDCVNTTANVLTSMPSGWSVPVKVSVCSTGVGAVGVLLQLVISPSRIAPSAIGESRAAARLCMETCPFSAGRWHAKRPSLARPGNFPRDFAAVLGKASC